MSKWRYDTADNVAFADGSGTYERGWYAASPSTVEAAGAPEKGPFGERADAVRMAVELARHENQVGFFTSGEWDSGGTLEIVAGKWGSDVPTLAVACCDLPLGIDGYANARLMAASKRLLETLEALVLRCGHPDYGLDTSATKDGLDNCDILAKARQLIYEVRRPAQEG